LDGADIGAAAEFISCKSEAAGRKNDSAGFSLLLSVAEFTNIYRVLKAVLGGHAHCSYASCDACMARASCLCRKTKACRMSGQHAAGRW
jgi:hypothetical protein